MSKSASQQISRSANQQVSKSANSEPPTAEQILDLMLQALEERRAARASVEMLGSRGAEEQESKADELPLTPAEPSREPQPGEEEWGRPPPLLPSVHLGRTLGRLLLVVALLVVLVNVPLNRHGTSLARMMPDSAALVIRDGLVLKGSGPDIYVLQDDRLRWISSLEAFEFFGYRWEQVHVVEDSFLEKFARGHPIHVLLKCQGSPHIYALENGQKRWIKDIPTFEAEGYIWEDVKIVDCLYLRGLPDGPPIPEDAGPPPQP